MQKCTKSYQHTERNHNLNQECACTNSVKTTHAHTTYFRCIFMQNTIKCTCTHAYKMQANTQTATHILCMRARMHTDVHACTQTCTHMYTRTHMHACIPYQLVGLSYLEEEKIEKKTLGLMIMNATETLTLSKNHWKQNNLNLSGSDFDFPKSQRPGFGSGSNNGQGWGY